MLHNFTDNLSHRYFVKSFAKVLRRKCMCKISFSIKKLRNKYLKTNSVKTALGNKKQRNHGVIPLQMVKREYHESFDISQEND